MTAGDDGTGMAIGLTGAFRVLDGGRTVSLPRSGQRVLALLALSERPVLRGRIAGELWDGTQAQALNSLRTALWRLHTARPGLVRSSADRIGLDPTVTVDVVEFAQLARAMISQPVLMLDRATELLVHVDVLPDWDDGWVVADRERLRMLRLEALEVAATTFMSRGRATEALLAASAAVSTEPLRESAQRIVVGVHIARGNIADALRVYRTYRALLNHDFGVQPSPAMEELMAPWTGSVRGSACR